MDSARFLRDYWQQQALYLPAQADFDNPLSPEELAGLALEPGVEARLVREQAGDWHLDKNPLHDSSFDGDSPWTLLVQRVDHYVPAVAALRDRVSFLPSWRLDDIMVSFATDGGGVGPHYDNYDVFLLQGQGQRRWRLGQHCKADTPLRDNPDLRILASFEDSEEFLLEPGDVLYVPPGLAHWGTAVGNGMTYSIGFRAPRLSEMLSRWTDATLPEIGHEQLYRDPTPLPPGRPGEIDQHSIDAARQQVRALLDPQRQRDGQSDDWFGELVTEPFETPAFPAEEPLPPRVILDPGSRLAWREIDGQINVYANGETLRAQVGTELLIALCSGQSVGVPDEAEGRELLEALWRMGCLLDD